MVLNRPEVHNAFNGELIENILEALEAADNQTVRSLVPPEAVQTFVLVETSTICVL